MSRGSVVLLHKKLSELESELVGAFHLLPHSAAHQKFSRRIQKRFDYINNLLAAEVASTPEKDDQLDEIGEKLTGLQAVFQCWTDYRDYALNMYHDDALVSSVCSDCMDNDVGGGDEPVDDLGGGLDSGRSWGRLGKLCGAFGSGVIVGVVCCTAIIDFASSHFLQYEDLCFMTPT